MESPTQRCKESNSSSRVSISEIRIERMLTEENFPIFLTFSELHGKRFVMKVFPIEDNQISPYYQRESCLLPLSHPNIVSVLDCTSETEGYCDGVKVKYSAVLMEFIPRGTSCKVMTNKM